MAMRQVVMESAMGMEMVALPLAVGDDFGVDVEGFGEVGADVWGVGGFGTSAKTLKGEAAAIDHETAAPCAPERNLDAAIGIPMSDVAP